VTATEWLFPATSGAVFSPDRRYRYRLWRVWGDDGSKRCMFIMLNPSTADEAVLDPTMRRCVGFAKAWGFGALEVGNLFALRSTDPDELLRDPSPTEHEPGLNLSWLRQASDLCERVVLAWGSHRAVRASNTDQIIKVIAACDRRKIGYLPHPKTAKLAHPLYLPASTPFTPWLSS
jgi:hypothetical protein